LKITNIGNLPQPLYEAICKVDAKYSPGESDITVTQLIDSPRIRLLRKKHEVEIEEDASQMIWKFMGSLSHQILQEQCSFNKLIEERLFIDVSGWRLSGQLDLLEHDTLSDYKITSKYSVKNGVKNEWEKQLNVLAYLVIKNGLTVKDLQLVAIIRDAGRIDEKVMVLPVKMWDMSVAMEYIENRVRKHQLAEDGFNELGAVGLCTEEERWYVPPKYAVMKKGNKKAIKLFDNVNEAIKKATFLNGSEKLEAKKKHYVEPRKGANKRCEGYCSVAPFCDWWQAQVPPCGKEKDK
jgi:hypothetical protein